MKVEHDLINCKFLIRLNQSEGKIDYHRGPEKSYNLTHTTVPPELQGKGLAGELVKFAILTAKNENVKIIATCPYVRSWFEKHPEESSLLLQN